MDADAPQCTLRDLRISLAELADGSFRVTLTAPDGRTGCSDVALCDNRQSRKRRRIQSAVGDDDDDDDDDEGEGEGEGGSESHAADPSAAAASTTTTAHHLPVEIVCHIFSYLPAAQVMRMEGVCRGWHDIICR
jgi:hypothetical protein